MQSKLELENCDDLSTAQTAPAEVLLKIFEYLKLKDRQATRLVCRKWSNVCQDKRFQAREKFCIEKFYMNYLRNVLEFFTSVDRDYFNFEFNGLNFQDDSPHFWEICGPRIYSLEFIECELSVVTFSHIVTNCTRLQQLTLRVCKQFIGPAGERDNQTRELDLQTIVENDRVNTSVQSVGLYFRGLKHQWSRWLVQIFELFPNIKHFLFFGDEFTWDYEVMIPAHLVAINEALFSNRIEDLRLVTYQYQYRELDWTVLATKLHLTMLTEVAIHVNDSTDRDLLASFIGRQRNLEVLHFLLRTSYQHSVMDDSFDIIFKNCPKLNDLKLTSVSRLSWGSKWFELLAMSSVRSLKVECTDIVFPEMRKRPTNSTMNKLDVQFKSYFNSSTLPLIEAFSCLHVLIIFKITDKIMRAILQLQKHLVVFSARFKTRLISSEIACESFGITNDRDLIPLDFSNLHVERLSIPADLTKYASFLSPHLKYLHLHPPMGEVFYNPISLDTELSPLLEEVIIETSCFSYPFNGTFTDNILKFIRPLKRLRYLYLTSRTRLVYSSDMPYLADDFVRSVFERCPSLSCFIYKRIYFRNNLNRKCLTVAEMDEHLLRISSTSFKNIHLPSVQFALQL